MSKWTDTKIAAQKPKEGAASRYVAIDEAGLYLRVRRGLDAGRETIHRSWEYRAQVNGSRRYIALGRYPAIGLADAREKARNLAKRAAEAKQGEADHPAIVERHRRAKQRAEPTVAELFKLFKEELTLKGRSARTIAIHQSNFDNDIAPRIGDAKAGKLTADQLDACIEAAKKRGALGQAQQIYKTERAFVNFAIERRILAVDPMAAIKAPKPYNPRQGSANAADDAELAALLRTLKASHIWPSVQAAIRFQLLTGARPSEVREAKWSEIDRNAALWKLPPERVKTRREFRIHLSDAAIKVLDEIASLRTDSDYLFPGAQGGMLEKMAITRALARLDKRITEAKGRALRPHDLRRTFRTLLSRIGIAPHVSERCLNHTPTNALERAYDAYDYWSQMVEAWEKAGAHMTAIEAGGAQVIPIGRAA